MPAKKTPEEIESINKKLESYIKRTKIPIVAEFAYQNDIRRPFLYEEPTLAYTIKKLIDKKEAQLERLGLEKKIEKTMAIFSLKQLGWRDDNSSSSGLTDQEVESLRRIAKQNTDL